MARGRGERQDVHANIDRIHSSLDTYLRSFPRPYPCESSSVACLRALGRQHAGERIPRKDIHHDDLSSHI
jgi:hypothetical protein